MDTIERVKDWVESNGEYDRESHTWADSINPYRLKEFLSSLAAERCVWKASDSPYYYWELSCHGGGSNDQANTSWEYCPYCGKRIEVKEVKHERD